jgi:hypothetical protein
MYISHTTSHMWLFGGNPSKSWLNQNQQHNVSLPLYFRILYGTVQTNAEAVKIIVTKVIPGQTKLTRDVN